jgi:hypothetical protein
MCGNCGDEFTPEQGIISQDSETHTSFTCFDCSILSYDSTYSLEKNLKILKDFINYSRSEGIAINEEYTTNLFNAYTKRIKTLKERN